MKALAASARHPDPQLLSISDGTFISIIMPIPSDYNPGHPSALYYPLLWLFAGGAVTRAARTRRDLGRMGPGAAAVAWVGGKAGVGVGIPTIKYCWPFAVIRMYTGT